MGPIEAYLVQGRAAGEGVLAILDQMEDRQLKAINLCREWLQTLLPHVMSKVQLGCSAL